MAKVDLQNIVLQNVSVNLSCHILASLSERDVKKPIIHQAETDDGTFRIKAALIYKI